MISAVYDPAAPPLITNLPAPPADPIIVIERAIQIRFAFCSNQIQVRRSNHILTPWVSTT